MKLVCIVNVKQEKWEYIKMDAIDAILIVGR